jgi:hypothetical protein
MMRLLALYALYALAGSALVTVAMTVVAMLQELNDTTTALIGITVMTAAGAAQAVTGRPRRE